MGRSEKAKGPTEMRNELTEALCQASGNKSEAARLRRFDRSTLYRRMKRYGLGE